MTHGFRLTMGVMILLACAAMPAAVRADFVPHRIVVLRLGDGSAAVGTAAQALFLDEYDMATGNLVASHAVPATGADALTLSGRGRHDGHLNMSSDGRYLLLGGYRANAGDPNPVPNTPAQVNRVIGRVDSQWNVDTSTALGDAYDRTDITAVASDDGTRFWTVGDGKYDDMENIINNFLTPTTTGGLRYINQLGATASINLSHVQTIDYDGDGKVVGLWPDSIRSTRIVTEQLYITTPAYESFIYRGAYRTDTPLPTAATDTPQTMIPVITNAPPSTDTGGKFVPKSDIILLDLDPAVPGVDVAYTTGGKDDYEKWSLVGGIWIKHSTKLLPSGQEINAFGVEVTDAAVTLFAVTDQGIYQLTDTAGHNADFSATFPLAHFIQAGTNTELRGISVITRPVPPIPGDFDDDGDVDTDDLGTFTHCDTGPAIPYDTEAMPSGCSLAPQNDGRIPADFDRDGDVDQEDFGVLQRCLTGPGVMGKPNCAD